MSKSFRSLCNALKNIANQFDESASLNKQKTLQLLHKTPETSVVELEIANGETVAEPR